MIRHVTGNILDDDAEALVNPVNCVGVMGAGLAKQFKERFPDNFRKYLEACETGAVKLGSVYVTEEDGPLSRIYIVNFPTKRHWKDRSHLAWIACGLMDLRRTCGDLGIRSLAIPQVGCGLGGLDWADVLPLVEAAFYGLRDVDVRAYGPPRRVTPAGPSA